MKDKFYLILFTFIIIFMIVLIGLFILEEMTWAGRILCCKQNGGEMLTIGLDATICSVNYTGCEVNLTSIIEERNSWK